MEGRQGLGSGLKALILGAGAAVAVAGLAAVWRDRPVPELQPTTVPALVSPAPAPTPAPPVPQGETVKTAPPVLTPPGFDVVRVEPDGAALVAGRADAGQQVAVLIDGTEAARTQADPQGRFVLFLTLSPSSTARVMTLELRPSAGGAVPSREQVLLAPTPAATGTTTAETAGTAAQAKKAGPPAPSGVAAAPVATSADPQAGLAPEAPGLDRSLPGPPLAAAPGEPSPGAVPAAILLSGGTARVLQAPQGGMASPGAVSIETLSYTDGGDVTLSGRGGARARILLYLDNRVASETAVGEDGRWVGTLPGLAAGLHTVRADQVSAAGTVTSRFETRFQREDPTALEAATPAQTETATSAVPLTGRISITVQPGASLWKIAHESYGDGMLYVRVLEANRSMIRDPDLIYPGQVLSVPQAAD